MSNERFAKASGFVSSGIGDGLILVPIRHRAGDLEEVYTFNATAAHIWSLVDGQRTVDEIHGEVAALFDVDREESERDVLQFLGQLRDLGAIEAV